MEDDLAPLSLLARRPSLAPASAPHHPVLFVGGRRTSSHF